MKERPYAAMVVGLLMMSAAYVGGYVLLVTPRRPFTAPKPLADGSYLLVGFANYRCAPQFCEKFFLPLEQLDRRLRPQQWEAIVSNPESALRIKTLSVVPQTDAEPAADEEP